MKVFYPERRGEMQGTRRYGQSADCKTDSATVIHAWTRREGGKYDMIAEPVIIDDEFFHRLDAAGAMRKAGYILGNAHPLCQHAPTEGGTWCRLRLRQRASHGGSVLRKSVLRKSVDESVAHVADVARVLPLQLEDALDDRDFCRRRVDPGERAPVCEIPHTHEERDRERAREIGDRATTIVSACCTTAKAIHPHHHSPLTTIPAPMTSEPRLTVPACA